MTPETPEVTKTTETAKATEATKATSELDRLKAKIEQLRNLVTQVASERDIAVDTMQRMGMGLQSMTDVKQKLKEIGLNDRP